MCQRTGNLNSLEPQQRRNSRRNLLKLLLTQIATSPSVDWHDLCFGVFSGEETS